MNENGAEDKGKFPTVGNLDRPDPEWSPDQLGEFAKHQDDLCAGLGRKMAVHRYREGYALTLARNKLTEHGEWGKFLAKHGIATSTDARVRKLYEEVGSEEELQGMMVMDAYVRYGIEKERKQKSAKKADEEPKEESADSPEPPTDDVNDPQEEKPDDVNDSQEQQAADDGIEPQQEGVWEEYHRELMEQLERHAEKHGWSTDQQVKVLNELLFNEPRVENMMEMVMDEGLGDRLQFQLANFDYGNPAEPVGLYQFLESTTAGIKEFRDEPLDDDSLALIEELIVRLNEMKNAVCV